MAKRNKDNSKKLRNSILLCALFGILLSAGTYAWFIGMQSVYVSTFDIKIKTTEGLSLSMDAVKWYDETEALDVNSAPVYATNTNLWAPDGLIPISTVGDTDTKSSRMILFEKASLTTTEGGYRLLASRVNNFKKIASGDGFEQGEGYVAFDLFIRNKSGEEYYTKNDPLNEEAIYLTTNSQVKISEAGVKNTGIENSVRIGFMQVGRIEQDGYDATIAQGITCNDDTSKKITGICRTATIWEPNDIYHVKNAISWYEKACSQRIGEKVHLEDSYTTDVCGTVVDGTANATYAVANTLAVGSNVDVYDGEEFNNYSATTVKSKDYFEEGYDKATAKLVDLDYFTDTEKMHVGADRPTFMTLAPNSITKVRVYIWIEGQDIDNYDFSSLGKQFTVNFGFTKERFTEEEIYNASPSV